MKGISIIIVVTLVLVIVISIVGSMYVWSSKIVTSMTSVAYNATNTTITSAATSFRIISARGTPVP